MFDLEKYKPMNERTSSLAQSFVADNVGLAGSDMNFTQQPEISDAQMMAMFTAAMPQSQFPEDPYMQPNPTKIQTEVTDEYRPIAGSYFDKAGTLEGGSKGYDAYNEGSGAAGRYQMLKSTGDALAKELGITTPHRSRTPDEQERMMRLHTQRNEQTLRRNNIEVNDFTRYVAHQQGGAGAVKLLKHGIGNMKNIRSNLPKGVDPTVANFLAYWKKKI